MKRLEIELPEDVDTSDFKNWTDADWKNDSVGHQNEIDGINCSKCKNKGLIYKMEGEYAVGYECECMAKRRAVRSANKSGLKNLLNYRIRDFQTTFEWQKIIKEKAIQYVTNNSKSWFIALGQPGAGKTHICSAIAKTFIDKGINVKYIVWPTFIKEVRNELYFKNNLEAFDYEKKVDVLYIDDFLKGSNSENSLEIAFDILNYRYNNKLTTLISSELLMNELNDIDAAIAGRIYQSAEGFLFQINKNEKNNFRLL
ncbi:MAG: ATP-binding protein [Thomasclavelia sp.]